MLILLAVFEPEFLVTQLLAKKKKKRKKKKQQNKKTKKNSNKTKKRVVFYGHKNYGIIFAAVVIISSLSLSSFMLILLVFINCSKVFLTFSFVLFQVLFELLQYMLTQYHGFFLESIYSMIVFISSPFQLLMWFKYLLFRCQLASSVIFKMSFQF